ncbi:MAG TPA: prepilin-type N-terminal cleavage/methylation domain-containing protein [Phycisphaerales bacterium]|nr:prepilin-type N-terminal cleavage/methylation domain-containing protein [Phycisphaerales bacterium]
MKNTHPISTTRFPLRPSIARRKRAFTLTELMVVVGIIALLAAILLTALAKVVITSKKSQTESRMQQFANACIAFETDLGYYPGVIPDDILAASAPGGAPTLSGTENAYLNLVGGYRLFKPTDGPADTTNPIYADYWNFYNAALSTNSLIDIRILTGSGDWLLAVDSRKLGEGPRINGKNYPAFYNPGKNDMQIVEGQVDTSPPPHHAPLPDLVDAWGQPIIYLHQLRDRGNLVDVYTNNPQFITAGMLPFTTNTTSNPSAPAVGLGELAIKQDKSIFNTGPVYGNLSKIISNPAFPNKSRGQIVLISAGNDGVYFANDDGPGSPATGQQVNDITALDSRVVSDYDDVVFITGG